MESALPLGDRVFLYSAKAVLVVCELGVAGLRKKISFLISHESPEDS